MTKSAHAGCRNVSGVTCDRRVAAKVKGKVYKKVVRPAGLFGLETVKLIKRQEEELEETVKDAEIHFWSDENGYDEEGAGWMFWRCS